MIRPLKTLWFFLVVGMALGLMSIVLPPDGIQVAGFTIHLPTLESYLVKDTTSYADITDLIKNSEDIDSLPDITKVLPQEKLTIHGIEKIDPKDTIKAKAGELAKSIYRIKFPRGGRKELLNFFKKLKTKNSIRVMHYGDSQLEGDRITNYIRNKLQKKYGGSGPGLIPALQPYDSYASIIQSNEGNWLRFPIFGKVNPRVQHNKYGPLAAFSRFAPLMPDSLYTDSIIYHAAITIKESKVSYNSVRNFQKISVFYGNTRRPVEIKIKEKESLVTTDTLLVNTDFSVFQYVLAEPTKEVRIEFAGADSPDIYGISLEATSGVSVDNIALRGSSGTFFRKIDYAQLQKAYNVLDVDLFIMQFGGNVMPYVKDSADVIRYGKWFYSQLATVRKMHPQAAMIVIGPSDMSYKQGGKYISYPLLPLVRDELQKAAFKAGCGYWDMYEAMGGYNSMPSWVRAKPSLAGADYTHFTPRGAKLIANMFYNALMVESIKK